MSYRTVTPAVVAMMFVMVLPAWGQTVWHVDDDAPPGGDGLTWDTAFVDLQDALDLAVAGDDILVGQGSYRPDRGTYDRYVCFEIGDGVGMYGGYAGYGASDPDKRSVDLYQTVLTGDLFGDDSPDFQNNKENSFLVVRHYYSGESSTLDGFTVTAAKYSSGMQIHESEATARNCSFVGNWSDSWGGGMNIYGGSPTVVRCSFIDNWAESSGGGSTAAIVSPRSSAAHSSAIRSTDRVPRAVQGCSSRVRIATQLWSIASLRPTGHGWEVAPVCTTHWPTRHS